ncbi:MAG: universal stress protein [Thermoplasmata archaeon]
MYGKVVVPTDGSELSYLGVEEGLRAAKLYDIPAVAVYVINPSSYSLTFAGNELGGLESFDRELIREGLIKQGKNHLKTVEERAKKIGVSLKTKVVDGIPHQEINKLADEDDVIYMSSHGWSGLSSIFLGSTTERVIKHSKATVAVVKASPKSE